jgi:hypothetical protein
VNLSSEMPMTWKAMLLTASLLEHVVVLEGKSCLRYINRFIVLRLLNRPVDHNSLSFSLKVHRKILTTLT